jgi:hypothetical protein
MPNWHAMTADAVLDHVKTSSQGLSVREVQQRLTLLVKSVKPFPLGYTGLP